MGGIQTKNVEHFSSHAVDNNTIVGTFSGRCLFMEEAFGGAWLDAIMMIVLYWYFVRLERGRWWLVVGGGGGGVYSSTLPRFLQVHRNRHRVGCSELVGGAGVEKGCVLFGNVSCRKLTGKAIKATICNPLSPPPQPASSSDRYCCSAVRILLGGLVLFCLFCVYFFMLISSLPPTRCVG